MEKLTKSLSLFKERNCSVSIVLDSRTRRKNACEFPLSLRFTIDRKFFYFTVGSSFTEKKFSDICNATKCKSENYKFQKEWKDTIAPKYKEILMNLNKGGILTFEMVRQCIMGEEVGLSKEDTTQSQSFISIWEQVIHELRTEDGGARFTTAESYECSLKSFRKILGENAIKGFCVCAAELQKWKDGMHNGVKDENGAIVGKISDTTAGIYLRCCRAVWNRCVHEGYLKDVPYPFPTKRERTCEHSQECKTQAELLERKPDDGTIQPFRIKEVSRTLVGRICATCALFIGIISCPISLQRFQYG